MKPDLTLLYSELGLQPNCSLAELQLAYRRRISELHAGHAAGGPHSPESTESLRVLIGLYTTATRFHRRYGRLPGAPPPHRPPSGSGALGGALRIPHGSAAPRASSRSRIAVGVAVAFLVVLFGLLAVASGEWLH